MTQTENANVHSLTPITALGTTTPASDTHNGVTLSENTNLALASVSARLGHETACRTHLSDLLEADAPAPGKAQMHDPEAAFWLGPDQWMVGAPHQTHENLADQLKNRFQNTASIVEQTDAWCAFDLRGIGIEPVMELLCPINIRKMRSGDATRTTIHHLACFVIRREDHNHLRILGPRASAGSLHHAIVTAMKSAL